MAFEGLSRVDPGLGASGWVISREPLLTEGAGGALQGLVAAGETPPDAAPSPLSVSVATLGVTLHLSTAGKWLGQGLSGADVVLSQGCSTLEQ